MEICSRKLELKCRFYLARTFYRAYHPFYVSGGSRDVDKKKAQSLEDRGPGWGGGGEDISI